MLLSVDSF